MNQWAGYVSGTIEERDRRLKRQLDELTDLADSYRRRLAYVEERITELQRAVP